MNGAVMNLAPTGSASNLLPDGCTVHSTLPPLSRLKKKEFASAQMTDYPMTCKELKKLRQKIGFCPEDEKHNLLTLNMDERSMFSHRLLAWSSHRLCEATNNFDETFGSVPLVNFFGDLGQLGPVDSRDLHIEPGKSSAPDELAGFAIYRKFEDCIVLDQTMRQGKDEQDLLQRLLRIRNGTVNQKDWIDINNRYEKDLSTNDKRSFEHGQVMTLYETWAEVRKENHAKLSKLGVPIAVIPSTGRGRHHQQGEKQVGQLVPKVKLGVGARVILTKNQGSLTQLGLNNWALGKVIAIFCMSLVQLHQVCQLQSYAISLLTEDHHG